MQKQIVTGIILVSVLTACAGSTVETPKPNQTTEIKHQQEQIQENKGQILPITAKTQMGSQIIELEVTATPAQQQLGLMYRQNLPDDRGMLFSFEPARPVKFWMKNTLIELDMVFLRDGKISAIADNVPPCKNEPCPVYGPETDIDQVIELRGGRAAELGLKIGDRVTIEFIKP